MKRSILTAAVALLVVVGLAVAAQTSSAGVTAHASGVLPAKGHYQGVDHHGRQITFYYNGNHQMEHFTVSTVVNHHVVSSLYIGGAHLIAHESRWARTCHGGKCTSGAWVSDIQVHGTWDHGNAHDHIPYHASWVRP